MWPLEFSKCGQQSFQKEVRLKVDIRLPGKRDSNSHGARPVHQKHQWTRTSRLSIKNSLSLRLPESSCSSTAVPPTPYTSYPTPYTPHPSSHTLRPTSYTQQPGSLRALKVSRLPSHLQAPPCPVSRPRMARASGCFGSGGCWSSHRFSMASVPTDYRDISTLLLECRSVAVV